MAEILIADDNEQIVSILTEYAKKEGHHITIAYDGNQVLEQFSKQKFDAVLLDVMMPKRDGFEVCREIRKKSGVPIILITARGEDFERIMGLDIGADDYIVKPFSPGEVMARIRAILRRIDRTAENEFVQNKLCVGNLCVSLDDYTVFVDQNAIALTKKEIELLWVMASHPNKVFTRDNLLDSVWGYEYFGDSRTVDSHIKRLRAKLDDYEHKKWELKTIWGVGYKLEVTA